MSVFNVSTKGSYIEGVVDIHMACSIDIARVKRYHITVIPSQRIGRRRQRLKYRHRVVRDGVPFLDIGAVGHEHRSDRQTKCVVE